VKRRRLIFAVFATLAVVVCSAGLAVATTRPVSCEVVSSSTLQNEKLERRRVNRRRRRDDLRPVSVSAAGAAPAPVLESSWQRSERECAARHRGDVYFELNEPRPATPSSLDDAKNLGAGFTLHL
jgi:hypothetical protein